MKIDTLVLSGGSTKVPAYVGVFRALQECNIINDTLDNIKHIVVCSVGMLYALLILLKVNEQVNNAIIMRLDFAELIDMDNVNISELMFNLGLFDNSKVGLMIQTILRERYSKEDMTLQELYEISTIKLSVKVVNSSKSCVEYISYETDPEISIITLLKMTTAIPLFFKPVEYKGSIYVDGGLAGGYPVEVAGDNYLGIKLRGPWTTSKGLIDEIPIIPFILSLTTIASTRQEEEDDRTIVIPSNIHFTNFSLSIEEKNKLIEDGYNLTKEHIDKYKLTTD